MIGRADDKKRLVSQLQKLLTDITVAEPVVIKKKNDDYAAEYDKLPFWSKMFFGYYEQFHVYKWKSIRKLFNKVNADFADVYTLSDDDLDDIADAIKIIKEYNELST